MACSLILNYTDPIFDSLLYWSCLLLSIILVQSSILYDTWSILFYTGPVFDTLVYWFCFEFSIILAQSLIFFYYSA